jgi:hypothetical protein
MVLTVGGEGTSGGCCASLLRDSGLDGGCVAI